MSETYTLAPNAIFPSFQGEGALVGTPMVFIRLAGCSIGCPRCDTDYRAASRATPAEIACMAQGAAFPGHRRWAWITGGEPADRDIKLLVYALRDVGFSVALATSGQRETLPLFYWDWLSVSPHDPAEWTVKRGNELKLVPGLAHAHLADFEPFLDGADFEHRFVQPCAGKPETLAECLDWVKRKPRWRLGVQAQSVWGLP